MVREASGRSLGDALPPPLRDKGAFSHQWAGVVTGPLGVEPLDEVSAQSRFGGDRPLTPHPAEERTRSRASCC